MSATASKTEQLNVILDNLLTSLSGEINGASVVSGDGITYAARFPNNINTDRVGAIAATTLGVSNRVARDLGMGSPSETIIQCEGGFFIIVPVNDKTLLALNLRRGGNLGMTRLEASDYSKQIALVMS